MSGGSVASELVNAAVISGALVAVVVGVEAAKRRWSLQPELTRKLAHVLAGIALVVVPWRLTSLWAPVLFAVGFYALMHGTKLLGLLPSVHGIERRSGGALVYPVAVLGTYLLADGSALLFQVPMLVMAISDALAATVGRAIGRRRYFVLRQSRTVEGSAAFFASALAIVLVGLVASGVPPSAALPCALLVALLVTACEAVSVGGMDNLVVPLATFFLLDTFAARPSVELWAHVALIAGAFAVIGLLLRARAATFARDVPRLLTSYAALALYAVYLGS
jgi:dolichol kinase